MILKKVSDDKYAILSDDRKKIASLIVGEYIKYEVTAEELNKSVIDEWMVLAELSTLSRIKSYSTMDSILVADSLVDMKHSFNRYLANKVEAKKDNGGSGTSYYQFNDRWKNIYDVILSKKYNYTEGMILHHTSLLFFDNLEARKSRLNTLRMLFNDMFDENSKTTLEFPTNISTLSIPSEMHEVNDMLVQHRMNYAIGNVCKVSFTLTTGRHEGTSLERDVLKSIYFIDSELDRLSGLRGWKKYTQLHS